MTKTLAIYEAEPMHVFGRTAFKNQLLPLFWTGSGIEINVTGTEMYLDIRVDFDWYEPWLEIVLDNGFSQRRMLDHGKQRICIFRAMDPGKIRNVKVFKATQAICNDPKSSVLIEAIVTDGELMPLQPYARKIEVAGDSITSGEGLGGALSERTWNANAFGYVNSYPYLLGDMLNADIHVISHSGFGVYCNWCGERKETIPPYYDQICGLAPGDKNAELGAHDKWNFSLWQPDAVIVNLGTNDSGSFMQPGAFYADRNWTNPMRIDCRGSPNEEDRGFILSAAVDFMKTIRKYNPACRILWCYGMLPGCMEATLKESVEKYRLETGDQQAMYVSLPATENGEFGARRHPGFPAHRKAAAILCDQLRGFGV